MKIKSFVFENIIYAAALAAALVALGVGFSLIPSTGEQSKIAYEGDLWCVSNYIEQRPIEYLEDGRPRKDERLDDRVDWIRKEQVKAESKAEAETAATSEYFQPSTADELRGWLDANDKDNFVTHFNTGATTPGPCIGSGFGNGMAGKWVNDGLNEDCFGILANTGNCEVSSDPIELVGKGSIAMPASGKIVQESHLVTKEEGFQPSSTSDRIEDHYRITQEAIGMTFSHRDKWTPAEGGGNVGQGSGSPPPATVEPWVMNMYWKNKPAEGMRVIITNPANGKSVVATAGYETGPSDKTPYLLGAQEEVMQALGVTTGSTVTVGFAKDQSLPFGPIECTETDKEKTPERVPSSPSYCPDEPLAWGPSVGEDYQLQIAKQYEQTLSAQNKPVGGDPISGLGGIDITGSGECALPIPGNTHVVSGLTGRRGRSQHRGLDFSAPTGTPIVSVLDGTVVLVEDFGFPDGSGNKWGNTSENGGFGNLLRIKHNNGTYSEYHHIKSGSFQVKQGDTVKKGQVVAQVDHNGWSSGPHLHFQMMTSNSSTENFFDPSKCLGLR